MANKIKTSRERIIEMMDILKITQADIVKRTKIPKSSLSNYISGKRTPAQSQLSVLSDPYGINPAWLMGYDVSMFLSDLPQSFNTPAEFEKAWHDAGGGKHPIQLSNEEYMLIVNIRTLNDDNFIKRVLAYIKTLQEMSDAFI